MVATTAGANSRLSRAGLSAEAADNTTGTPAHANSTPSGRVTLRIAKHTPARRASRAPTPAELTGRHKATTPHASAPATRGCSRPPIVHTAIGPDVARAATPRAPARHEPILRP